MGLMDNKYTFAELTRKYNCFRVPAFRVKIEGKELPKADVETVSATLSLDGASAINFRVVGAYEVKNSGFSTAVKSKLKLGAKVTLELGYGSSLTQVFQGYISNVGVDFSDTPALEISAMDARRLMMEGESREITHVVTTYSAAFEAVIKAYKSLCPKVEVDATDSKEIVQIVQRTSDYKFIHEILCRKANREFFMLNDTAYFRKPAKSKTPVVTLRWGEGLTSFSRSSLYQNLKITVIGYDDENKKAVTAHVAEKADEAQKTVGAQHEIVISDPDAAEVKKAKTRAEQEAQQRKRKAQSGSAVCIGLPELVPGRFISLKGLDKELDVDYYIREVRHEAGPEAFITTLSIGGWEK